MASKLKPARLESEIERCRVEANWKRALELAQQLGQKSPDMISLVNFILAESKLEEFLSEHPPSERTVAKAKSELNETEQQLCEISRNKAATKLSYESELLLAKLHYCKGAYQAALSTLEKSKFEDEKFSTTSLSNRHLLLLAESHAIKGMCLEKTALNSTSKFKVNEREQQIISCLEKAGDIALLYLQEKEKYQSNSGVMVIPAHPNETIGCIIDYAIQQTPILYIKNGELEKGIGRFRDLLRAVEVRSTQNLRLTLARQLAEVLLRGVCANTYITISLSPLKEKAVSPKIYEGDHLFVPSNQNEEILLLLLIAEAVATREAVLDRTQELNETRLHAFNNAAAIYDLLTITLVKRAQFTSLAESFERAMRFSFEEFHIWHQMANSLICAGRHAQALLVLNECNRLQPDNAVVCLQAARLCYEYLHQYNEGIEWSVKVIDKCSNGHLLSRANTALGIGYSMKASETKLRSEREKLHVHALSAFRKSYSLDPYDYLALFHLALQLAILRQIPEAFNFVKLALKYRNDHIHSLHLLALLLTSQKQYEEALVLIHAALEEYPDNLSLLLTKSKLEEIVIGPEEALTTCKLMLKLWKDIHEIDSDDGSDIKAPAVDRNTFDKRSLAQLTINEFSERGSGSIRAESIAASRMERALSEVASSLNSAFHPRSGSQQSWMLQAQIWLHLAELFISLDKTSEADNCVNETSGLFPLSHQVYFMKGRVLEHKQRYLEAKICYENSVAINPGHTKSLHHLGMVLHNLNENKLAEKALREAVNADPTSHQSWLSLGIVLEELGHHDAAADCHAKGIELELTSPIVSFTVIPRLMQ